MKQFLFLSTMFVLSLNTQAWETTNSRGTPQYEVDEQAIAAGPAVNMSTQSICDGEQGFKVNIDRDLMTKGGQLIPSCDMYLNPYFAQLFKAFVPKCAKEAAVATGMNIPTSVSIEQLGGFVKRNARNSNQLSRHALGMAMDVSSITLQYNGGNTQRIDLTKDTKNQPFYDSFRSCWDKSVAVVNGKNCACSVGHTHTHKPSNDLHDDHMHLALACPPGGAITCSNDFEPQNFALGSKLEE
jgi:Extensin-like protein C-terminus